MQVYIEEGKWDNTAKFLKSRGHKVIKLNDGRSAVQMIRMMEDGTLAAMADPRKDGISAGI
jgi:gamma-glutamyltranspeptidase